MVIFQAFCNILLYMGLDNFEIGRLDELSHMIF